MQGGFSIREYASRMRSINVVNSWPFDEAVSEETVKSLLPPITVKKFTWWIDELEYKHSESAKDSVNKKKEKIEKGEIDAEEVVKVKSLKEKMKAPKKRSILDISAVEPPVERLVSDEEEDCIPESKRKTMKKNKNKDVMLSKALRIAMNIKKRAQRQQNEFGQSDSNKEKSFKLKRRAQDKATGNRSSSCSKELECNTRDCVSTLKRKPSLQHVDAYKKTMPFGAFKSIQEDRLSGLSACGIFKNQGDAFSDLKQSKQVTFSEKDEGIRLGRKPSHSIEYYEFQKVCGSDMGNADLEGGVGKDPTLMETSGSEDDSVHFNIEKRKHASLASTSMNICGRSITGINEDFFGLPLNSQGELIALNSSATREDNQMINYSDIASCSITNVVLKCFGRHSESLSSDCRTSSMNQLNLFPVERYVKTDNDSNFLGTSYNDSFFDSESIMLKGKSPGNEKIHQPRMRLMGKEFEISGTVSRGFEDGNVWKDEHIVDELHHSGISFTSNGVHYRNEPSTRKSTETYNLSQREYDFPHLDRQTSSIYPSVYLVSKIDPSLRLCQGTFSDFLGNDSSSSEPFTSGYEPQWSTLEFPTPTASHQELHPRMNPTAMQLKNKKHQHQHQRHSPKSSIRFPFLHPNLDWHDASSWNRTSVNRAPLSFDVPEKATQLNGHSHPYLKHGSGHGTDSSLPLEPDGFHTFFPSASNRSIAPMPYHPGMFMQKRRRNQKKFKEHIKSRIGIGAIDNGKKSKTQPSALSTVSFKPLIRMPTLGSHGNTQCAIRKPTPHLSFEDAFESCSAANKSKSAGRGKYEIKIDERVISAWVDSHVGTSKTVPTYSDGKIRVAAGFRFSESENSAKIYRKTPFFEL